MSDAAKMYRNLLCWGLGAAMAGLLSGRTSLRLLGPRPQPGTAPGRRPRH